MGYLVKASFNAEPRSYALDGIRTDVKASLLSLTAMVREEKQDFWYSVGELIGEKPTAMFKFVCDQCKTMISARKIDVGLSMKCGSCSTALLVPDIEARKLAIQDHDMLKSARGMMVAGSLTALVGIICSVFTYLAANEFGAGHFLVFTGLIGGGLGVLNMGWVKRGRFYSKYSPAKK
jgi:hypothetical protein